MAPYRALRDGRMRIPPESADMVMHLRPGATVAYKECFFRQIAPSDGGSNRKPVPIWQRGNERFSPYLPGMAVRQLGRSGREHNVQVVTAKLHDRIACGAFRHFDLNARAIFPASRDQVRKEAMRDQGVDADVKAAAFSRSRHAGGLHGVVQLIDARRDMLDGAAAGLRQPNAPRMADEQKDAEVFFKRFHAGADARLANAKRIGCMADVQIFGDGKRLNERHEGNARPERGWRAPLTVNDRC